MSQEQLKNDGSRATTSVLGAMPAPDVGDMIAKTKRVVDKVRVVHGANHQYFDNLVGKNVGAVRKSLRNSFNIPGDAVATVEGKQVGDDFVLAAGQNLEFSKEAGVKGAP